MIEKTRDEFIKMFADPNSRFWWGYLLAFVMISVAIGWVQSKRRGARAADGSPASAPASMTAFFRDLSRPYFTRSSLNDLRMAAVNVIVVAAFSYYIYDYLLISRGLSQFLHQLIESAPGFAGEPLLNYSLAGKIAFVLAQVIVMDIAFFGWHWAYHRVPALWELHKLHHSAEVLTPFTILRGDPYLIVPYILLFEIAFALNAAAFYFVFHILPTPMTILGAPAGMFVLYSLRDHFCHSHLRISFGPLNYVVLSPIQHQVHHSYLPQHQGKNLAFMFSFMDLLCGTFYNPKADEVLKIGIDGVEEKKINALCIGRLLVYPLQAIARSAWSRAPSGKALEWTRPEWKGKL